MNLQKKKKIQEKKIIEEKNNICLATKKDINLNFNPHVFYSIKYFI